MQHIHHCSPANHCPSNLLQPLLVIILKPVSLCFLKAPLKLITAVFQFLTTDISRNLKFLHSRRTDTHWRTKQLSHSCHRHDHPIRNVWHHLRQVCHLLHSLHNVQGSISRLKAVSYIFLYFKQFFLL